MQLERSYKNFYLGQPSELSQYFTTDLLTPITWTPEQKLSELACTCDLARFHAARSSMLPSQISQQKILIDIGARFSQSCTYRLS